MKRRRWRAFLKTAGMPPHEVNPVLTRKKNPSEEQKQLEPHTRGCQKSAEQYPKTWFCLQEAAC